MHTQKKSCILATKNQGKIREFKELFSDMGIDFLSLNDVEAPPEIVEDGKNFFENAFKKAKTISEHYGVMAISDDSGLEVDALDGRPGIYSARFAGEGASDEENYLKLLQELEGVEDEKRTARFRCVMVAYRPDGKWIKAEGSLEGVITREPRGTKGFGYDPVFLVPALGKTLAEIPMEEKNKISHRARALQALRESIEEIL